MLQPSHVKKRKKVNEFRQHKGHIDFQARGEVPLLVNNGANNRPPAL